MKYKDAVAACAQDAEDAVDSCTMKSARRWAGACEPQATTASCRGITDRLSFFVDVARLGCVPALVLLDGAHDAVSSSSAKKLRGWILGALGANDVTVTVGEATTCCAKLSERSVSLESSDEVLQAEGEAELKVFYSVLDGSLVVRAEDGQADETVSLTLDDLSLWRRAAEDVGSHHSVRRLVAACARSKSSAVEFAGSAVDELSDALMKRRYPEAKELTSVFDQLRSACRSFIASDSVKLLKQLTELARERRSDGEKLLTESERPVGERGLPTFKDLVLTGRVRWIEESCMPTLRRAAAKLAKRLVLGDAFVVHEARWLAEDVAEVLNKLGGKK